MAAVKLPGLGPWPGWRHLPRESRDTLFLMGVIGWTVMPHLFNLPPWCGVMTALVLLWRTRLALGNQPLPGRWVLVLVLALAAGLTLWSFKTLLGKEPGITLLVVLMALKTLELRARRDAFVTFFLGFFLVLTHFLYSQSLPVAVAMLASVWGLLTAVVLAHMPVGRPPLRQAGGLALRTAVLGAPIMVLLFVLFPRIGPLWGVPQDGLGKTGLSGTMQMGRMAEVAQDDSIAMRVRFLDRAPPSESLYFRGPVLSRFDGTTWSPGNASLTPARAPLRTRGAPVQYEITLEPSRLALLPALDGTTAVARSEGLAPVQRDDLVWSTSRPILERLRFTATAYPDFAHGPQTRDASLRENLALPTGYNPRTLAWAAELARQPGLADAGSHALAQAVMNHIARGGFTYTLTPGTYGEANPRAALDEFWLDRKEGFCEHFAAAFVVILRALDVPARIVTGYQGTELPPIDGFYLVRQTYAHAWAEYWVEGTGWVRADPTAAVAPDRILRSRNLAPAPGLVGSAIGTLSPEVLTSLRRAWETVNNRWNQWVLNYSRGQQFDLMRKFGFDSPDWEDLARLLIGAFSALALFGAAWAWWDRHRQDPWQRQSQQVRRALQALGLAAAAHDPPRTLAGQVRDRFGEHGNALAALLQALDQQRYGPQPLKRPSAAWLRALLGEARGLRSRVRAGPR